MDLKVGDLLVFNSGGCVVWWNSRTSNHEVFLHSVLLSLFLGSPWFLVSEVCKCNHGIFFCFFLLVV